MFWIIFAAAALLGSEWAMKNYIKRQPQEALPRTLGKGAVELQPRENRGLMYGALESRGKLPHILSAGAVVATAALCLGPLRKRGLWWEQLGAGLLLGGGLANFLDRVKHGAVLDYLRLPKVKWQKLRRTVFDLADVGILLGGVLLLLGQLRRGGR